MKKISIFLLLVFFYASIGLSQNESDFNKYHIDFAVSDLPAFKMLGIEPSNLLRPSKSDVVSFMTSNMLNPGEVILPNSFAAEIAPYLLLKQNSITATDFSNNYPLYNTRFSLGTLKDDKTKQYKLGVGIKVSVIDKGDLRKDLDYIKKIEKISLAAVNMNDILEYEYSKLDTNHKDPKYFDKMDAYVSLKMKEYNDANNKLIKEEEEIYKKNNWNKEKFDIAIGALGSSPDSLAKNIQLNLISLWSTYAFPISNYGQLLIGGNVAYNNLSDKGLGSISYRIYLGNNNIKGFFETQYKKDNNINSANWFLCLGTELNVFKNVWINYYAGYESNKINAENSSKFLSQFDIKLALQ